MNVWLQTYIATGTLAIQRTRWGSLRLAPTTQHAHVGMYACTHTHTHTGRERQSTYTVRLTRGKRAGIPQSWKVSLVSAGGVGQSLQACLDLSKACSSYTQVLCTRHMMNHTDRHPHHQWYLLVFVQEMAYDNEHVQKTLSSLPVHTQYSLPHFEISMTAWWNLPFYGSWPFI